MSLRHEAADLRCPLMGRYSVIRGNIGSMRVLLIGARAPGHDGYQRATGTFESPMFACAGKTGPPSRLILSQTSAGKYSTNRV